MNDNHLIELNRRFWLVDDAGGGLEKSVRQRRRDSDAPSTLALEGPIPSVKSTDVDGGDSEKDAENIRRQRRAIASVLSENPGLPVVPWGELLARHRVVILAEAGAGKTEELTLRECALREEGKNAFLCQMEDIAREGDFRKALLPEDAERFDEWLKGGEDGYFFVDAADEVKLTGNFQVAATFRRLSWALSGIQGRARLFVSSRASELDVGRDFTAFVKCLCSEKPLSIVRLLPLNPEQQELFVGNLGLSGGKEMLDAARQIGDYLVNRPLDLRATAKYWETHGRIDSPMKMTEHSVTENLRERDPVRDKKRPLSSNKARRGAEDLAATLTLCGESRIRIPSSAFSRPDGIDASDALPDWGADDVSALLERPVFDPGIYGAVVNFHHREVREYLAACWSKRILYDRGLSGSVRSVLHAFQAAKYGEKFVYPAMRPVAAWLAQMEQGKFCDWMSKAEPIAMMLHGDPSILSPELRGDILRNAAHKIGGNLETERVYNISLGRFGGAGIADAINELLDKFNGRANVVEFLLRIVAEGKISECADKALAIALSKTTPEDLRVSAINAIANANAKHAEKLAEGAANQAEKWPGRTLTHAMRLLFPQSMSIGQFVRCIEKGAGTWERLNSDSYLLESVPLDAMDAGQLREFMNGILAAAKARAKPSGAWAESLTATLAARALMLLLDSTNVPHEDEDILRAAEALNNYRGTGFSNQGEVVAKISANWRLIYALFWRVFHRKGRVAFYMGMLRLPDNPELFLAFLSDLQNKTDEKEREEAFWAIWNWNSQTRSQEEILSEMRNALAGDDEMLRKMDERLEQRAKGDRRQKRRDAVRKGRERKRKEAEEKQLRDSVEAVREMAPQLCDFDTVAPPEVVHALSYLEDWVRRNSAKSGDESDESDACRWESMGPAFGEEAARCARDGMMKFWRTYTPPLVSETRAGKSSWSTDTRVFLGIAGLDILHRQQPDWADKLTAAEASLAARYATHSSNQFPKWFAALVLKHPDAAGEVIRAEMEKDIREFSSGDTSPNILPAMLHSGESVGKFFALIALDVLEENPTAGRGAWHYVSRLLHFLKEGDGAKRKVRFYRRRVDETDDIAERPFWLAEWMRADANAALNELERHLLDISNPDDAKKFMVNFCGNLGDEMRAQDAEALREAGLLNNVALLRKTLHLTLAYVRYKDDIDRAGGGVYSPGIRDHAQDFRRVLFNHLVECSGEDAHRAMMALSEDKNLDNRTRETLRVYARRCAEKAAEAEFPFENPAKVVAFAKGSVQPFHAPGASFFQRVLSILDELRDNLENGDFSEAESLSSGDEKTTQTWFAARLEERGKGRFGVNRESEVVRGKRPDIRIRSDKGGRMISIEVKIADRYSFAKLREALRKQLPQYLRDPKARHGILLLVHNGKKRGWKTPSKKSANFAEVREALESEAKQLAPEMKGVGDIRVVGVDLSLAGKKNGKGR